MTSFSAGPEARVAVHLPRQAATAHQGTSPRDAIESSLLIAPATVVELMA